MLKNKKAIYVLLPLNVCIWMYFISTFFHTSPDATNGKQAAAYQVSENRVDTIRYRLRCDYPDPFAMQSERRVQVNLPSKKSKLPSENKAMVPAQKLVKYYGLIRNNITGAVTALVSVNGVSQLVRPKESIGDLCFVKFFSDSIVVHHGVELFIVRK